METPFGLETSVQKTLKLHSERITYLQNTIDYLYSEKKKVTVV